MTRLITGDCLDVMPTLEANSVDSVICDPPYGLDFMGKAWDHGVPGVEFWQAALRVAKPGAILMAFGGTRTYHRLTCAIEDAGWELRDCMMWLYGSGFPKSLNIGKAVGAEWQGYGTALKPAHEDIIIAQKPLDSQTERGIIVANLYQLEAQLWSLLDVNTAEKLFKSNRPDYDAACAFARWSACEKQNIQEGLFAQMDTLQFASVMTSCLNTVMSWSSTLADALDDGKMSTTETESSQTIDLKTLSFCLSALTPSSIIKAAITQPGSWQNALPAARYLSAVVAKLNSTPQRFAVESATAKALTLRQGEEGLNLIPDFAPIIVAMKPLDGTYAENAQKWGVAGLNIDGGRIGTETVPINHLDQWSGFGEEKCPGYQREINNKGRWPANLLLDEESARLLPGGASRFFYTAKASPSERNAGLEDCEGQKVNDGRNTPIDNPFQRGETIRRNTHPTVKPVDLMRYLCKLTKTPTGGVVLDPFMGSGTTGVACVLEHRDFIGIELQAEYAEIARKRIADMSGPLFAEAA